MTEPVAEPATEAARHRAAGPPAGEPGVTVVRSEERLVPGVVREPVERVRVHREVVVEQVTRTFEVRREVLRIEREPLGAGGAVSEPDGGRGARTVELVLREERPVVTLEVVPTERVRVSVVVADDRTVTVTDDVRVEHVDVDTAAAPLP